MGNILKGILYTGLAGIVGVGGYMIGKYKHMGGKISLTMVGLALILYAPKGCDVAETYIKERAGIEKARAYGLAHKDSIDAVVNSARLRDSTSYLKQLIQSSSGVGKKLENTYKDIIKDNEDRYKNLLQKNDEQYDRVLGGMIQQNEILKKDLESLKLNTTDNKSYANPDKRNIASKTNVNFADSANWVRAGKLLSVKKYDLGLTEERILPDGTKVMILYQRKQPVMVFTDGSK